jgi:hypothetical protein
MRVAAAFALAVLGLAVAVAAEFQLRDPLAYPNMLSAPVGEALRCYIGLLTPSLAPAQRARAESEAGRGRFALLALCLLHAGYNPTMAGHLRQGRIPRRYIVRMNGGKDMRKTIAR